MTPNEAQAKIEELRSLASAMRTFDYRTSAANGVAIDAANGFDAIADALSSLSAGRAEPERKPYCDTDCGDGSTMYDARPRTEHYINGLEDQIASLKSERVDLQQQLAAAQAVIAADRKRDRTSWQEWVEEWNALTPEQRTAIDGMTVLRAMTETADVRRELKAKEEECERLKKLNATYMEELVGLNVIESDSNRKPETDAYVRQQFRESLDRIEWMKENTDKYRTESEVMMDVLAENETQAARIAELEKENARLRENLADHSREVTLTGPLELRSRAEVEDGPLTPEWCIANGATGEGPACG